MKNYWTVIQFIKMERIILQVFHNVEWVCKEDALDSVSGGDYEPSDCYEYEPDEIMKYLSFEHWEPFIVNDNKPDQVDKELRIFLEADRIDKEEAERMIEIRKKNEKLNK